MRYIEFDGERELSIEEKARIANCPFGILKQGNQIVLLKQFRFRTALDSGEGKYAYERIKTYSGLRELFLDFRYSREWFCYVREETVSEIDYVIDSVYFLRSEVARKYLPSQKYTLFRQFNRCHTRTKQNEVRTVSFLPYLYGALEQEDSYNNVFPESYDDWLEYIDSKKYYLPDDNIYILNNCDDVLWWVTEQIIYHNQEIMICSVCGAYYIGANSSQKFCSKKCFQENRAVGRFCGDKNIQNLYMAIYQSFRRKIQSKLRYCYADALLEDADIILAFLSSEEQKAATKEGYLTSNDFKHIKHAFDKDYRAKYDRFKKAILEKNEAQYSEMEVKNSRNELSSWLEKVKKQLSQFQHY